MDIVLTATETRVIGSLIEKELTTPEYYPLTLNALTNACNQKNNREPVVAFEETTVARALESLREKKLIFMVTGAGIRVPKYRHNMTDTYSLIPKELAVICLLMLRGPQTIGEIRGRTASMCTFENTQDIQSALDAMSVNEHRPLLVKKLARLPGQKEARYAQLLSGEPHTEQPAQATRIEPAVLQVRSENERIKELEKQIISLKEMIANLQQQFAEFKKQFE
jgi:uncharacterized protein YceH (UPF0502 family)